MSDKNDKGDPVEKPLSDSAELFDSIFSEEPTSEEQTVDPSDTLEIKPDVASKPSKEQTKPPVKKPDPGKKPINKEVKPPVSSIDRESAIKEDNVKEDKRIERRSDTERETVRQKEGGIPLQEKPKKRLNPLVLILSIVVLATLTGFFIHYYGIVGFKKLIGSSIGSSKPVKKEMIRLRIDKKGQDKRVAKKVSTPSMVKEKGKGKKEIPVSLKTSKQKETIPGVKQRPSVPLHAGKSPAKKTPDLRERTVSYPYSMYLGSFQTLKAVHETVSKYRKIGLSPYWIKLDLGDKGRWFRLFAGYFRTREGADTFIKVKQIREAQLFHTKYANLIGTYTSSGALDKKQAALLELGYGPYVISDKKDVFRLYVGAFSLKVRAEKQNADLVSKGVQSQFVKR